MKWELDSRPADALVIGSQLGYGSVGLNASVPTLAAAGLRVAALPTTILSNLPHYPSVHGFASEPAWITAALGDLTDLGVANQVGTVCTGYFATVDQVAAVADWLSGLLVDRPQLRVIIDPTLGDDDVGAYTDLAVADAIRDRLLPLATGMTPNVFELDHLTGRSSATPDRQARSVVERARVLLGPRAEWAVLTGVNEQDLQREPSARPAGGLPARRGADVVVTSDGCVPIWHDRLDTEVKGAGDVFTAAIVCALHEDGDIVDAVRYAGSTVRRRLTLRAGAASRSGGC